MSDEVNFEARLHRLEEIVEELESGELPLDDAFDAFEEGVALARELRERLDDAEGRVMELLDDGSLETRTE